MEKKWDVFTYGDINIDLILPGVREVPPYGQEKMVDQMDTYVGGGAALFTLGLGKLGLHPVFQGMVGDDFYGEYLLRQMREKNVDTCLLEVSREHNTGISISFTDETDRSFLTYMGTNQVIDISHMRIGEVKKARHVHMTGYAGSRNHEAYETILKTLKKECEVSVSFDVGWDDSGEWSDGILELLPYIDVLFMNETEALHYGRTRTPEEAVGKFAALGPLAVGKFGTRGSYAVKGKETYRAGAYRVEAVDTTGAGDSFNAGFVFGYLTGKSVGECLKYGNACGACSVTKPGGNTGFPDYDELCKFIEGKEKGAI